MEQRRGSDMQIEILDSASKQLNDEYALSIYDRSQDGSCCAYVTDEEDE